MTERKSGKEPGVGKAGWMGFNDQMRQRSYEMGKKLADGFMDEMNNTPEGWKPPGADRWNRRVQRRANPSIPVPPTGYRQPHIEIEEPDRRPTPFQRLLGAGMRLLAAVVEEKAEERRNRPQGQRALEDKQGKKKTPPDVIEGHFK